MGLGDVGLVLAAGDEQRRQAAGEVAADAAGRGLDVVVVATDLGGRVTDALRDAGLACELDE